MSTKQKYDGKIRDENKFLYRNATTKIHTFITRTHEKNTVMNLFQKLECSILFKKPTILDSMQFCEDFYIFAKIVP
ncbi:hypothetical protein EHR03_08920 [Leptospira mayottensis]|nr:hypothetical protein EHR03_08920 [Leptospira mayottensis]